MSADSIYPVSRPNGYGIRKESSVAGERWYWGPVRTPDGIVIVYSEKRVTTLDLIRDGKEYSRRFDRGYERRHLVTLAARFAKETADAHR